MEDQPTEEEPATPESDDAELRQRVERYSGGTESLKRAWQQTLDDMDAIAEEHREAGHDVTAIPAVETGPIGRDTNDPDGEFGMEFVVADNHAEEFEAAFAAGDYPEYDVYRGEAGEDAFVVVELVDPDAERAILLAGGYPIRDETMCAFAAREEDEMYTFVRTLDGTRYGAFRHEGYEKFFPRAGDLPEDPEQLGNF
ncbi:hypothetical protein HALDL1_16435 [Halobacterium sp. DL1]|jgi:hypothetical protein|nr:hypothetical protein HALDL1_16435 [Halobacterium sp. DL1]